MSGGTPATLPRGARLLRREQYTQTLATGAAARRRHFTVFVRPNGAGVARIGMVASKRNAPRAVDRNRAKRLVREAFRGLRGRLAAVDIVVELRRCPSREAWPAARAEIMRLLEEAGLPRPA